MTANMDKVLREAIEKRYQKWDELLKQKDFDGLMTNIFSANAKMMLPAGETLVGKEAILDFVQKSFSAPNTAQVVRVEEVNGEGVWAYARGTFKVTQGSNEIDGGKFVTVWKKINNEYQVHIDIWNSSKK